MNNVKNIVLGRFKWLFIILAASFLSANLYYASWRIKQIVDNEYYYRRTTYQAHNYPLPKTTKFAYAYIIAGCTESSCFGYILNALASAYSLRWHGSAADIVLMVRMFGRKKDNRLLPLHEEWIRKAGIKLRYLPKLRVDNFGTASLEKFRILEMTEYERVLFLDSDILPICNMDWIFYESINGTFSDFTVFQSAAAPATAAIFLAKPQKGEFQSIMDLVNRTRQRGFTTFNYREAWGHVIRHPDSWKAWNRAGNDWTMYGGWADQGLLYHHAKYQRLNFSQYISIRGGHAVETWRDVTANPNYWKKQNKMLIPVGEKILAMIDYQEHPVKGCGLSTQYREPQMNFPPYNEYYHFSGERKPWDNPILSSAIPDTIAGQSLANSNDATKIWLFCLGQANKTFGLSLPQMITVGKGNPLGYLPNKHDLFLANIEIPKSLDWLTVQLSNESRF